MKRIVIAGAGTAGTIMANKLSAELNPDEWQIVIIDKSDIHFYQSGFLFIPFDIYKEREVYRKTTDILPKYTKFVKAEIKKFSPPRNKVILDDNSEVDYDILIIATGVQVLPQLTLGLQQNNWYKNIFDFYTLSGSLHLREKLRNWQGGRIVMNIADHPFKCPVAPLEFTYLTDWYLEENGLRDKTEIFFVTPQDRIFPKPKASEILSNVMEDKNVDIVTDFKVKEVDNTNNKLISEEEDEINYDLLITIPANRGADAIKESSLGDKYSYVLTDPHTLRSKQYENVFVIGDTTNLESSKATSVAHFQSATLLENILNYIEGREMNASFDGHSYCFIESGFNKGLLIDFNYDTEPLPGKFPLPGIGPFSLLSESRMNHYGKIMFRWAYWNLILKGLDFPIDYNLTMAGKRV